MPSLANGLVSGQSRMTSEFGTSSVAVKPGGDEHAVEVEERLRGVVVARHGGIVQRGDALAVLLVGVRLALQEEAREVAAEP